MELRNIAVMESIVTFFFARALRARPITSCELSSSQTKKTKPVVPCAAVKLATCVMNVEQKNVHNFVIFGVSLSLLTSVCHFDSGRL